MTILQLALVIIFGYFFYSSSNFLSVESQLLKGRMLSGVDRPLPVDVPGQMSGKLTNTSQISSASRPVDAEGAPIIVKHRLHDNEYQQNSVQYINHESTFSMICIADREANCSWMLNEMPFNLTNVKLEKLPNSTSSYVVEFDKSLTSGSYQCQCSNSRGTALSPTTVLEVAAPADVYTFIQEAFPEQSTIPVHNVEEGNPLRLDCDPPLSQPRNIGDIFWNFSGRSGELKLSSRIQLDYEGNIYFANVLQSDDQQYECVVNNYVRMATVSGNYQKIKVSKTATGLQNAYKEPVLRWSSPVNDTGLVGSTKTLKCIFSGYPTPQVTWFRRDGPMQASMTLTPEGHGTEIQLSNLTTEDTGTYRCATTSATGRSESRDIHLTVEAPPSWKENYKKRIFMSDGDSAEFVCPVTGAPTPSINWTINGHAIVDNSRIRIENNILKYFSLSKTDTQVLQCLATNKHGSLLTNLALTVLAEPPKITPLTNGTLVIERGQNITFQCRAEGYPPPDLTWKTPEKIVKDKILNYTENDVSYLTIQNALQTENGSYSCEANNKFGSDKAKFDIIVKGPPGPVRIVTVVGNNSDTLTIAWQKAKTNNVPNITYVIEYTNMNRSISKRKVIDDVDSGVSRSDTMTTVLQVVPWSRYNVSIFAVNEIGRSMSHKKSQILFNSNPRLPERNPTGVCAKQRKEPGLVVVWTPLDRFEANGEGFYYIITYTRLDLGPDYNQTNTVNITGVATSQIIITDEQEFGNYYITVQSANSIGILPISNNSSTYGYSAETVPSAPVWNLTLIPESLNRTSAVISWKSIEFNSSEINGFFKGYRVAWWTSESPSVKVIHDVILYPEVDYCMTSRRSYRSIYNQSVSDNNGTMTHQLSDLISGSIIRVSVSVINNQHQGPSTEIEFLTLPEIFRSDIAGASVSIKNLFSSDWIIIAGTGFLIFVIIFIVITLFSKRIKRKIYLLHDEEKKMKKKCDKVYNYNSRSHGVFTIPEDESLSQMDWLTLNESMGSGFQTWRSSVSAVLRDYKQDETDSMSTYYEYDMNPFNEEGSFIGIYRHPNK